MLYCVVFLVRLPSQDNNVPTSLFWHHPHLGLIQMWIVVFSIFSNRFSEYVLISFNIQQVILNLKGNARMTGKSFQCFHFLLLCMGENGRHDKRCFKCDSRFIKAHRIQLFQRQWFPFGIQVHRLSLTHIRCHLCRILNQVKHRFRIETGQEMLVPQPLFG